MTTVAAVYENGVFRQKASLDLAEGQEVNLSFTATVGSREADEGYIARLQAAKSLPELFAIMEAESCEPEIDVADLVNESRRSTGFRMPDTRFENKVN